MNKVLVIHEDKDEINYIQNKLTKEGYKVVHLQNLIGLEGKIKEENPDLILFDVRNINSEKDNYAKELIKKSIDANTANNYERLVERMNELQKCKGVKYEKETVLIIDKKVDNDNKIVRIGKVNNELLQFVENYEDRIDDYAKLFVEKTVNTIKNEANLEIKKIKAFANVLTNRDYKFLDGFQTQCKYDVREITENEYLEPRTSSL